MGVRGGFIGYRLLTRAARFDLLGNNKVGVTKEGVAAAAPRFPDVQSAFRAVSPVPGRERLGLSLQTTQCLPSVARGGKQTLG